MRSSLLDYVFSMLEFYKTAAGLRVNIIHKTVTNSSYCKAMR